MEIKKSFSTCKYIKYTFEAYRCTLDGKLCTIVENGVCDCYKRDPLYDKLQ